MTGEYSDCLEEIRCNFCGSNNRKVIYSPKHGDVVEIDLGYKFRSSEDEVLLDQLVQCKDSGHQYISPRLRSDMIIGGYSEGKYETFVSQILVHYSTWIIQIF